MIERDFKVYNDLPRMMPSPKSALTQQPGAAFGDMLKAAIQQVSDVEKTSPTELQKILSDESDLHSVMISLDKADLSFQFMMQVRNKIVQTYQEIMKTQV